VGKIAKTYTQELDKLISLGQRFEDKSYLGQSWKIQAGSSMKPLHEVFPAANMFGPKISPAQINL
jgi:hypothetical protein